MSTTFDASEIQRIAHALNMFPEAMWDKYLDDGQDIIVYGWLDRDDQYKDFIVIVIDQIDFTYWFVTSSDRYLRKFNNRHKHSYGIGNGHSKCLPIDRLLSGIRSGSLEEQPTETNQEKPTTPQQDQST